MPTYEYACPDCGIVEVFQSIKEKALTRCPQCKKRKVTRMLSGGGGVIFKGSGFWETDYNRSDDYKSKSKTESSDKSSEPSSAPKTEAKPQKVDSTPKTSDSGGSKGASTPKTGGSGGGSKKS
jgi:putative FmdB family regulatory protein